MRTLPILFVTLLAACQADDRCARINDKIASCAPAGAHASQSCTPGMLDAADEILAGSCDELVALGDGKADLFALGGCGADEYACYGLFCCNRCDPARPDVGCDAPELCNQEGRCASAVCDTNPGTCGQFGSPGEFACISVGGVHSACGRPREIDTGGGGCFEAGTAVSTPDGTRAIETLQVGDEVRSYDLAHRRFTTGKVTHTMVHRARSTGLLRLANGATLAVTAEHPIYSLDRKRFVRADALRAGDRLLLDGRSIAGRLLAGPVSRVTRRGAGAVRVSEAIRFDRTADVYNLTVSTEHNYFANDVLAHNKPP